MAPGTFSHSDLSWMTCEHLAQHSRPSLAGRLRWVVRRGSGRACRGWDAERVTNAKSMGAWGHHDHLHHSGMRRDEPRYKVGVRRGKKDV